MCQSQEWALCSNTVKQNVLGISADKYVTDNDIVNSRWDNVIVSFKRVMAVKVMESVAMTLFTDAILGLMITINYHGRYK